jgi:putative acetyltransferase
MIIRSEESKDYSAIRAINESAFETPAEANLVDVLRAEAQPIISLVAQDGESIVGHVMFSPASLTDHPDLKIMGLGPVAVLPHLQRRGIGTALINAGICKCRELGFNAVIVLGHPAYYPRFGFIPSVRYGIQSEYDVPDDVFMLLELQPGYFQGATGVIKYHPAFSNV